MISADEIDKAIFELENHDTTFATCEKLAWLYTVRDHIGGVFSKTIPQMDGSEFLIVASSCDSEKLLKVLDELMDCVRNVYPKEYDLIIEKLK